MKIAKKSFTQSQIKVKNGNFSNGTCGCGTSNAPPRITNDQLKIRFEKY